MQSVWPGRFEVCGLVKVLKEVIQKRGNPTVLRGDNGPEFASTALLAWATESGLTNMLIEPGKSWQNGTNESFNGKFRDECLATHWFKNRRHAKALIEQLRKHYNSVRPHSSLGYQAPIEFASGWGNVSTTEARISSETWSKKPKQARPAKQMNMRSLFSATR